MNVYEKYEYLRKAEAEMTKELEEGRVKVRTVLPPIDKPEPPKPPKGITNDDIFKWLKSGSKRHFR